MEAVIQSFMTGFPTLMLHSAVTLVMLFVATIIYIRITPYDDIGLIKAGNNASALSLGGAVLGFALPLSFAMGTSVNVYEILIWGAVSLFLQLIAYRVVDLLLQDLPKRIENDEISPAIFLVSVKLGIAMVNAAAITG